MLVTRFVRYIELFLLRRQIVGEIGRLVHPNAAVQEHARQTLRLAPAASRPMLRRVAFRHRSNLACAAAEMLYELGDLQGLYALLSQFSDRYMNAWYGEALRRAIRRIGPHKIVNVLKDCLDRIENDFVDLRHSLPRDYWPLNLSVYALNALSTLKAELDYDTWSRILKVSCPGYEDLRTCRSVVPINEVNMTTSDWYVGSTLAAVRRAAIDALLILRYPLAFDLLRDALTHPDVQVQLTAIYGLRRLRDQRAYVLLQPFVADRRHPLNRDARRAIEAFGSMQPDALTLVRASASLSELPDQLLRPASERSLQEVQNLLRPSVAEDAPPGRD